MLAPSVAVSTQIEYEAAYWIRGIAAISDHAVPGRVAVHGLVLAKRHEQIGKWLDGNFARSNGLPQRDEYGMRRPAGVAIAKLHVPSVEQLQGFRGIGNLVSQIVRPAAVGIEVVEMLPQAFRQQPRHDVEIFVVMRGQPARIALGLLHGATGRRRMPGNFEFSRILHYAQPPTGEPGAAWKTP